jgi:hypothetical protein
MPSNQTTQPKIQELVNKTATNNGYNIGPVYHGSPNKNITTFNPENHRPLQKRLMNKHPQAIAFFTNNKKKSSQYGHPYKVFLNFQNPHTINGAKIEQGKIGVEPGIHLHDAK